MTTTVRKLRETLGMNQKEFAEAIDLSQGGLSQVERGRNPSVETAMRIVAVARKYGQEVTLDAIYNVAA